MSCATVKGFVRVNGSLHTSLTLDESCMQFALYPGELSLQTSYVIHSKRGFCDLWKVQDGKTTPFFHLLQTRNEYYLHVSFQSAIVFVRKVRTTFSLF